MELCYNYPTRAYGFCESCNGTNLMCELYLTNEDAKSHRFFLERQLVSSNINERIGRLESLGELK